ncbi:tape measure protein [Azospirillum argentinense]
MASNANTLTVGLDFDTASFTRDLRAATAAMTTFQKAAKQTDGLLSSLAQGFSNAGDMANRMVMAGEKMTDLKRKLGAITSSINNTNKAFTGGAARVENYDETFGYLRGTALKTGSSFDDLAKSYAQLAPAAVSTGIAVEDVRRAIEGTIGAGQFMGASGEEMQGVFTAIRQAVGKGALELEDLGGQIGESLPNAMLIMSNGLTRLVRGDNQLAASLGLVGTQAEVTTAKLNQMITDGLISGNLFLRAWQQGTAEFAKFSELSSTTVSGQMNNLATIANTNIGGFMRDSGINQELAAGTELFASWLDNLTSITTDKAREIGDSLITGTLDAVQAMGRAFDSGLGAMLTKYIELGKDIVSTTVSIMSGVGEIVLSLMKLVPTEILEIGGIIGLMLFGAGGIAGLLKHVVKAVLGVAAVSEGLKLIDKATGGKLFGLKDGENPFDVAVDRVRRDANAVELGFLKTRVENGRQLQTINQGGIDTLNTWISANAANSDALFEDRTGIMGSPGYVYKMSSVLAERDKLVRNNDKVSASLHENIAAYEAAYKEGLELQTKKMNGMGGVSGAVGDLIGTNPLNGKPQEIGPAEQAVIRLRNDLARAGADAKAKIEQANRNPPKAISGFQPGDAITNLPESKRKDLLELNTGVVETFSTLEDGTLNISKILGSVTTNLKNFTNDYGKVFDEEESGKTKYGLADRKQYQSRFIMEGAQALSSVSVANLSPEHKERTVQALRNAIDTLRKKASESGTKVAIDQVDLIGKDIEAKIAAAGPRTGKMVQNSAIKQTMQNAQLAEYALTAYGELLSNRDLFDEKVRKEKLEISKGELAPDDRVYGRSEEELKALAINGMASNSKKSRAQTLLQIAGYSNDGYVETISENATKERQLALLQAQHQTRQQGLSSVVNDELTLEREKLAAQQARLDLIFQEKGLRDSMVANEVARLGTQTSQNTLQAGMMMTDQWRGAQYEADKSAVDVQMARLYYEYSLTAEQRLQLVRADGLRQFTDGFSGLISGVLSGQTGIIEGVRSMFANMTKYMLDFFAKWIAQQLMMKAITGIGSLLGFGGSSDPLSGWQAQAQAGGDAVMALYAPTAHSGGVLGSSRLATTLVSPSVFDGAPKLHSGGLLRGEVPIIAKRGEGVFTPEQMDNADNLLTSALTSGNTSPSIHQEVTVNVSGGAGTSEQNTDLADKIGRQVKAELRGLMTEEMRQQMRPGGLLRGGY